MWLTSRHLGGEGTGRPFPLSPRVTGNGIQAASRSPPPPGRSRGLLPPPSRGRAVSGDSPDTVHGKETGFHGDFGETDKSLPPTGHRIDGESPPWGRRLAGEGGGTSPSPVPTCHRERFSWSTPSRLGHNPMNFAKELLFWGVFLCRLYATASLLNSVPACFPCLLRLWLNVFRLTKPRLTQCRLAKNRTMQAVTRGIPHEDGGCTFIEIPVTPPESVHGLDTERFIKPVRHWFDGLLESCSLSWFILSPGRHSCRNRPTEWY